MSPHISDHVLPRPVEVLPEYANAAARQSLAKKLIEAYRLSEAASQAISAAVVDPSETRKAIGEPTDPQHENIAVPGGTLMGIRTHVWARKVVPDPRNPRLLPSRRHPFAVAPGTGGEDAKFRPISDPTSPEGSDGKTAEMVVHLDSREHFTWASQLAANFVLAENDWRASIASQGVMEAVWLVPTTYEHADGTQSTTTLTAAEGSSRITSTHKLLDVRTSDVPYEENDSQFRAYLRKLNDAFRRGATPDETVALRCERVPALILVGFQPHPGGTTTFPTAVKSLVALRHVDPPKPWGDGPENESLADEVLAELYRRDLISKPQWQYFAGACTREEAQAAHLSADPAIRAAQIVRLFTSSNDSIREAVQVAVTSQSTRKRITKGLRNELATALILRASAEDRSRIEQIRRYLRHGFAAPVQEETWDSTDRDPATLAAAAQGEVLKAIESGSGDAPGPASLELAVRASYALIASGSLYSDRGTAGNEQPDRRTPGQVLEGMRRSPQGVAQLRQALVDFRAGERIRAVDETGTVKLSEDGTAELYVNDTYLRGEFPPAGKARAQRAGDTPMDRYENAVGALVSAVSQLDEAYRVLQGVVGDDGQLMVETRGVDPQVCHNIRERVTRLEEDLIVWGSTYKRKLGLRAGAAPRPQEQSEEEEVEDDDLVVDAQPGGGLVMEWDEAAAKR
ncbi:MAG: hypothetical protein HYX47_12980 [Burkholderiales bacterium]|nr:hypothetical protein [Burkholderiales bacterium]